VGLKVLVAEDSDTNRQVVVFLLEQLGCVVDAVENGREAVEAVSRTAYDMILMDCQMPEMDGYEASRQIRSRQGDSAKPTIIALTAHAIPGEREKCLAAGMDDYLSKPFEMRQIAARLAELKPRAQESASVEEPAINADVMKAFRKQLGDGSARMLAPLITVFLREGEETVRDMQKAAAADDHQKMARGAHRLRGGSCNFGAKKLGEMCQELESRVRAGECKDTTESIARIHREFMRVVAALKKEK
jgi:CheY-like chemotaxis protein